MKVIIDNHLIDLEMVTHISTPKDNAFEIYLLNTKRPITIARLPYRHNDFAWANGDGGFTCFYLKNHPDLIPLCEEASTKIEKMWGELVKRWSPNTMKYENLTIE